MENMLSGKTPPKGKDKLIKCFALNQYSAFSKALQTFSDMFSSIVKQLEQCRMSCKSN